MEYPRMHTAEHILFRSLQKGNPKITLDKIKLGEDESSFYVFCKHLDWNQLIDAEKLANKIIKEDREITEEFIPKSDAIKMKDLRIKPERIKEDTVRVIRVKDFDVSACSGKHCNRTGEIKSVLITKFNSIGANRYQIRFKVDTEEDLFSLGTVARLAAESLNVEINQVVPALNNLKRDEEHYRNRFRELSKKLIKDVQRQQLGKVELVHNEYEDLEQKQLIEHAGKHSKESSVVCFFNKRKDKAQVIITTKHPKLRADELLKIIFKFGGNGGGREHFAMGEVGLDHIDHVLEEVKRIIHDTLN